MTQFPIPDSALAAHIALLGKTGAGKTTTGKDIVEHVVPAGFRVCVLDTIKSDWWGITSSATGKSPGLPFKILGGPRGHVPLHSSAGKVVGQLVGSGKLPLSIIDMADFEGRRHSTLLRRFRRSTVEERARRRLPRHRGGT